MEKRNDGTVFVCHRWENRKFHSKATGSCLRHYNCGLIPFQRNRYATLETTMFSRLVLTIACLVSYSSYAQEGAQRPSWLPKTSPDTFDLGSVSIAKISADKKTVQFAQPQLDYVEQTKVVEITVMQPRTEQRQIKDGDKTRTVNVTLYDPVTVKETRSFMVRSPAGSKTFKVAMDKISAWDLTGKSIDATTLAARLQEPTYVLAREDEPKYFTAIDPYYLSVLRPSTIIIYFPVGSIPASGPPPAPAAPAAPFAPAAPRAPASPAPTVDPPPSR